MDYFVTGVGYVSADYSVTIGTGKSALVKTLRHCTPEERASVGAQDVVRDPRPDDRYYFVQENLGAARITYTATPRSLDQVKAIRIAEVKAKSYAVEIGGCILGGATIDTSDRSKALLNGAYSRITRRLVGAADQAERDAILAETRAFDATTGPVMISNMQIIAMAEAMEGHVQACFDTRCSYIAALNALAAFEDVIAYDFSAGWPANPPPSGA